MEAPQGCCPQFRAACQHSGARRTKVLLGGSTESLAPFAFSCYETAKVPASQSKKSSCTENTSLRFHKVNIHFQKMYFASSHQDVPAFKGRARLSAGCLHPGRLAQDRAAPAGLCWWDSSSEVTIMETILKTFVGNHRSKGLLLFLKQYQNCFFHVQNFSTGCILHAEASSLRPCSGV